MCLVHRGELHSCVIQLESVMSVAICHGVSWRGVASVTSVAVSWQSATVFRGVVVSWSSTVFRDVVMSWSWRHGTSW